MNERMLDHVMRVASLLPALPALSVPPHAVVTRHWVCTCAFCLPYAVGFLGLSTEPSLKAVLDQCSWKR